MVSLRFPRREQLPTGVRASLPLESGERVLTHAPGADPERYVVCTDRALLVGPHPSWIRLPWWRVTAALFDADADLLRVTALQDDGPVQFDIAVPGLTRVPETVHERVQSSIVVSRHVRLARAGGARLVARRVPGRADLEWQVVLDSGLDPADQELRDAAARELDALRREMLG